MGAIPHQGQAHLGQGFQHGADPLDLFLSRKAADVEQQVARVAVAAVQAGTHGGVGQLRPEQLGVDPPLPESGVLDPLGGQFVHHGGGGAEIEFGLVVGGLEQLPEQGLQHAHAVVLQVFGQMGVVARHQGQVAGLGQPDAPQAEHGWVHHMHQIGPEALQGLRNRRPGEGQFELRVEGQWQGRHSHHPGTGMVVRGPFRAEDQHLVSGLHQMGQGFGEPRDNAVNLWQEGFGEEGNPHGRSVRFRRGCGGLPLAWWSRRRGRGCASGRSGRPSGGPHPPLRPTGRHRGWWG